MNSTLKFSVLFIISLLYSNLSFSLDIKSELTTDNINIDDKVIKSWGNQKDFFIDTNFIIIKWEKAKKILLTEKVRGGKQYHTGWLTIFLEDGNKYIVKQPMMDALWKFMEEKQLKLTGFGTE